MSKYGAVKFILRRYAPARFCAMANGLQPTAAGAEG